MPAARDVGHSKPPRRRVAGPPKPPAGPVGVFAHPPVRRTTPIQRQVVQARHRTRVAQRRLPPRPVPHVPIIANPTPAQTRAAHQAIAVGINRAVGPGGTGAQRQARRRDVTDELRATRQGRALLRAADHYSRVEEQRLSGVIARNRRDIVRPGPKRQLGGVPHFLLATALANTSLGGGSAENQFVKNALGDVKAIGVGPFVGGYEASAGAADVLQGRGTGRLRRLGAGIVEGAKTSVPGELVQGHPGAALESFRQHPVFAALDLAGAESLAGRSIGAFARGVGKQGAPGIRGRLADLGSTRAPGLALTHDDAGGVIERRRSKDVFRKAAQESLDAGRKRTAEANVMPLSELGRRRIANRRADMQSGRANAAERLAREEAAAAHTVSTRPGATARNVKARVKGEETRTGVAGRNARDVVALATQGTILTAKTMGGDLSRYLAKLDREYKARIGEKGFRHTGEAKMNRRNARLVKAVLRNPRALAQAKAIMAEAERHGKLLNEGDIAKAAAGIDELPRMRRAALEVPALEHMGARHFTVKEHAELERQALKRERMAEENLRRVEADKHAAPSAVRNRREALRQAREHRYAVSGRDPARLRAHEEAKAAHVEARAEVTRAQKAHASAKARVQALSAQHKSERGREVMTKGPVAAYHVGKKRFANRLEAEKYVKAQGLKRSAIERISISAEDAKRVGALSNARRAERSAYARVKQAQKDLVKATDRLKANRKPDIVEAIRYGEESRRLGFDKPAGHQLPNEDIEAFLRSKGRDPGTVAYLPHRGDIVGRRAYHQQLRPGTRPSDRPEVRTGSAYLKGATESTATLLKDQGVRQATQVANATQIDRFVGEHAMLHPASGKFKRGEQLTDKERRVISEGGGFTRKEAMETAQRALEDNGEYLVPISLHPVVTEGTRLVIRENMRGPGGMDSLGQRLLNDRVVTEGVPGDKGARNVGLISGHLFDRQMAQLRPPGAFLKAAQALNRAFRFAVLPQPRWLTGNFVEPYIVRLTPHGSGVNIPGLALDVSKSMTLYRRMLRSGDPRVRQAALDMNAHRLGGLFLGNRGASNRRALEDFPTLDRTVQQAYGKIVSQLPAVETFGKVTGMLLKGGGTAILAPLKAFFVVNRGIERVAQHAAEGHFLRDDLQEFTGSWFQTIKTGEKAWQEAMQGRVNTATQHRLMDQAHELLGKYDSWSPMMRAIVQGPAPFIPWLLNAVRFVYWTMPVHHSTLTSLLVKADQTVQEDWQTLHANVPPGSLKYAIPNGRGGWVDLARYTPYGATTPALGGEGLRDFKKQFFPQIGGVSAAVSGQDPFGRALQVPPSPANPRGEASPTQELEIAANQGLEAVVPYLSILRRLQEKGGTAYATSTVLSPKTKPGTSYMSALRRTFDPFRPTYLAAPTGGKSKPLVVAPTDAIHRALHSRAEGAARSGPPPEILKALAARGR